jgi:hypothetical protein
MQKAEGRPATPDSEQTAVDGAVTSPSCVLPYSLARRLPPGALSPPKGAPASWLTGR